jgi:hypothetical protein
MGDTTSRRTRVVEAGTHPSLTSAWPDRRARPPGVAPSARPSYSTGPRAPKRPEHAGAPRPVTRVRPARWRGSSALRASGRDRSKAPAIAAGCPDGRGAAAGPSPAGQWRGRLVTLRALQALLPVSGQVAQLVEHGTENPGVGSSILPLSTISFSMVIAS